MRKIKVIKEQSLETKRITRTIFEFSNWIAIISKKGNDDFDASEDDDFDNSGDSLSRININQNNSPIDDNNNNKASIIRNRSNR